MVGVAGEIMVASWKPSGVTVKVICLWPDSTGSSARPSRIDVSAGTWMLVDFGPTLQSLSPIWSYAKARQ